MFDDASESDDDEIAAAKGEAAGAGAPAVNEMFPALPEPGIAIRLETTRNGPAEPVNSSSARVLPTVLLEEHGRGSTRVQPLFLEPQRAVQSQVTDVLPGFNSQEVESPVSKAETPAEDNTLGASKDDGAAAAGVDDEFSDDFSEDDDDDDGGWITPSNIAAVKKKAKVRALDSSGAPVPVAILIAAC